MATKTESVISTTTEEQALNTVGIEFEIPIAPPHVSPIEEPGGCDIVDRRSKWIHEEIVQGEHCGTEIASHKLDLFTEEPEKWYIDSIHEVNSMLENDGLVFHPCSQSNTTFGLHIHVSDMNKETARSLERMSEKWWFRFFVDCGVTQRSPYPARYGAYSPKGGADLRHRIRKHYEWRSPGPVGPENLHYIMEFLRILSYDVDSAEEFARGKIIEKDPHITSLKQMKYLLNNVDDPFDGLRINNSVEQLLEHVNI